MTDLVPTPTHWFTIAFERVEPLAAGVTEDELHLAASTLSDALFEAGCDDAVVSFEDGGITAAFAREAAMRDEAVASATAAIERCGCRVLRVTDDEPA